MRPLSGVRMPAMHLRVTDLPLPEAPKKAVIKLSDSNLTFKVKPPKSFSISTNRLISSLLSFLQTY